MYETHFGLRQRPFRSTPDTTLYYPATTHERALARLMRALDDQEGLALLTAESGLGKTLICQVLLERLGEEVTSGILTNTHVRDRLGLLQAILYEFALPHEDRTEQDARLALTDFLLKNYAAGRKAVLIVDEAQHLAADLLEELRLLGNLEARGGKALQIVFSAQPGLTEMLQQPALASLRQRLAVRASLEPLPTEEAADYILHQLRAAGGRPDAVLPEEALLLLAKGSRGIPRFLNQAAHHAFVLASESGASQVDAEAALEALNLLGLEVEDADDSAVNSSVIREDASPLLSLADPVLSLANGPMPLQPADDGDLFARVVPPKRPA